MGKMRLPDRDGTSFQTTWIGYDVEFGRSLRKGARDNEIHGKGVHIVAPLTLVSKGAYKTNLVHAV